ncbi:MAG: lipid kinase [Planctomycetaceae bacterium]
MRQRALLLVNANSRRGQEDCEHIRMQLTSGGLDLIEPEAPGDEPSKLILQHAPHVDMIVLGGGDGTINRSLKSLLKVQLPLGILPLGTANDLARTLQLPRDLRAACEVILEGHRKSIDVGWVNDRPFLNVASIGVSESVTRRLSQGAKSRWGVLAYIWAAMGAMLRCRPFTVEIISSAGRRTTKTWQVAVGNGRNYGGGLTIHKDAQIDDGRFDLYSLEIERSWHVLPLIPALWSGTLDPVHTVFTMHDTEFEIRPVHRSRRITADGELLGHTPAIFRLEPKALSVFVPTNSLQSVT